MSSVSATGKFRSDIRSANKWVTELAEPWRKRRELFEDDQDKLQELEKIVEAREEQVATLQAQLEDVDTEKSTWQNKYEHLLRKHKALEEELHTLEAKVETEGSRVADLARLETELKTQKRQTLSYEQLIMQLVVMLDDVSDTHDASPLSFYGSDERSTQGKGYENVQLISRKILKLRNMGYDSRKAQDRKLQYLHEKISGLDNYIEALSGMPSPYLYPHSFPLPSEPDPNNTFELLRQSLSSSCTEIMTYMQSLSESWAPKLDDSKASPPRVEQHGMSPRATANRTSDDALLQEKMRALFQVLSPEDPVPIGTGVELFKELETRISGLRMQAKTPMNVPGTPAFYRGKYLKLRRAIERQIPTILELLPTPDSRLSTSSAPSSIEEDPYEAVLMDVNQFIDSLAKAQSQIKVRHNQQISALVTSMNSFLSTLGSCPSTEAVLHNLDQMKEDIKNGMPSLPESEWERHGKEWSRKVDLLLEGATDHAARHGLKPTSHSNDGKSVTAKLERLDAVIRSLQTLPHSSAAEATSLKSMEYKMTRFLEELEMKLKLPKAVTEKRILDAEFDRMLALVDAMMFRFKSLESDHNSMHEHIRVAQNREEQIQLILQQIHSKVSKHYQVLLDLGLAPSRSVSHRSHLIQGQDPLQGDVLDSIALLEATTTTIETRVESLFEKHLKAALETQPKPVEQTPEGESQLQQLHQNIKSLEQSLATARGSLDSRQDELHTYKKKWSDLYHRLHGLWCSLQVDIDASLLSNPVTFHTTFSNESPSEQSKALLDIVECIHEVAAKLALASKSKNSALGDTLAVMEQQAHQTQTLTLGQEHTLSQLISLLHSQVKSSASTDASPAKQLLPTPKMGDIRTMHDDQSGTPNQNLDYLIGVLGEGIRHTLRYVDDLRTDNSHCHNFLDTLHSILSNAPSIQIPPFQGPGAGDTRWRMRHIVDGTTQALQCLQHLQAQCDTLKETLQGTTRWLDQQVFVEDIITTLDISIDEIIDSHDPRLAINATVEGAPLVESCRRLMLRTRQLEDLANEASSKYHTVQAELQTMHNITIDILHPLKLPFLRDHLNFYDGVGVAERWPKGTHPKDILLHILDRVSEQEKEITKSRKLLDQHRKERLRVDELLRHRLPNLVSSIASIVGDGDFAFAQPYLAIEGPRPSSPRLSGNTSNMTTPMKGGDGMFLGDTLSTSAGIVLTLSSPRDSFPCDPSVPPSPAMSTGKGRLSAQSSALAMDRAECQWAELEGRVKGLMAGAEALRKDRANERRRRREMEDRLKVYSKRVAKYESQIEALCLTLEVDLEALGHACTGPGGIHALVECHTVAAALVESYKGLLEERQELSTKFHALRETEHGHREKWMTMEHSALQISNRILALVQELGLSPRGKEIDQSVLDANTSSEFSVSTPVVLDALEQLRTSVLSSYSADYRANKYKHAITSMSDLLEEFVNAIISQSQEGAPKARTDLVELLFTPNTGKASWWDRLAEIERSLAGEGISDSGLFVFAHLREKLKSISDVYQYLHRDQHHLIEVGNILGLFPENVPDSPAVSPISPDSDNAATEAAKMSAPATAQLDLIQRHGLHLKIREAISKLKIEHATCQRERESERQSYTAEIASMKATNSREVESLRTRLTEEMDNAMQRREQAMKQRQEDMEKAMEERMQAQETRALEKEALDKEIYQLKSALAESEGKCARTESELGRVTMDLDAQKQGVQSLVSGKDEKLLEYSATIKTLQTDRDEYEKALGSLHQYLMGLGRFGSREWFDAVEMTMNSTMIDADSVDELEESEVTPQDGTVSSLSHAITRRLFILAKDIRNTAMWGQDTKSELIESLDTIQALTEKLEAIEACVYDLVPHIQANLIGADGTIRYAQDDKEGKGVRDFGESLLRILEKRLGEQSKEIHHLVTDMRNMWDYSLKEMGFEGLTPSSTSTGGSVAILDAACKDMSSAVQIISSMVASFRNTTTDLVKRSSVLTETVYTIQQTIRISDAGPEDSPRFLALTTENIGEWILDVLKRMAQARDNLKASQNEHRQTRARCKEIHDAMVYVLKSIVMFDGESSIGILSSDILDHAIVELLLQIQNKIVAQFHKLDSLQEELVRRDDEWVDAKHDLMQALEACTEFEPHLVLPEGISGEDTPKQKKKGRRSSPMHSALTCLEANSNLSVRSIKDLVSLVVGHMERAQSEVLKRNSIIVKIKKQRNEEGGAGHLATLEKKLSEMLLRIKELDAEIHEANLRVSVAKEAEKQQKQLFMIYKEKATKEKKEYMAQIQDLHQGQEQLRLLKERNAELSSNLAITRNQLNESKARSEGQSPRLDGGVKKFGGKTYEEVIKDYHILLKEAEGKLQDAEAFQQGQAAEYESRIERLKQGLQGVAQFIQPED